MRRAVALLTLMATTGVVGTAVAQRVEQASDWRLAATADDRVRLRSWRSAWVKGIAQARQGGFASDVAALGALADPDHSIAEPGLPDGEYRCRTIKLGTQGRAVLTYVAYPFFRCRVSDSGASLTKLDGSQRLTGRIFADTDARSIFLGTMILGDEESSYPYGRDRARNMAGVVERIDAKRWRIAFPFPAYESVVDILELLPAGG
ncbi:DUF4893 domain-containing protein [Sphingomonas sp. Leaf21]|uniref:DUF4893 domain-containing protein n=1 Tax=Sphingomonas sp. Leaf21 TaxID=2876550 RepID=UPI001E45A0C8|nr:DUF4893 domain-containing protein [Sphingomonas sp. Leaf21]